MGDRLGTPGAVVFFSFSIFFYGIGRKILRVNENVGSGIERTGSLIKEILQQCCKQYQIVFFNVKIIVGLEKGRFFEDEVVFKRLSLRNRTGCGPDASERRRRPWR